MICVMKIGISWGGYESQTTPKYRGSFSWEVIPRKRQPLLTGRVGAYRNQKIKLASSWDENGCEAKIHLGCGSVRHVFVNLQ